MTTRAREEKGAVLPLIGVFVVVLALAVGFTLDLGSLAAKTRKLQAAADLIALDAAAELNGQSCATSYVKAGEIVPTSLWSHIQTAAYASAARNGFPWASMTIDPVVFQRSATYPYDILRDSSGKALVTSLPGCTPDTAVPEAVRIYTTGRVDYGFARVVGFSGSDPTRSALGKRTPIGSFIIGSVVTGMTGSNATLLNEMLTTAFCSAYQSAVAVSSGGSISGAVEAAYAANVGGSTTVGPVLTSPCKVSFSLAGYSGLAATSITMGDLASRMGFGSPEALMTSNVTIGELFSGAASSVDCTGQPASCPTAKADMAALGAVMSAQSTATATLGSMFTFNGGSGPAAKLTLDLFNLVTGTAQVINGVNFFSLGNSNTGVPGITNTRTTVDVIEAPRTYVGPVNGSITTSQARVTVDTDFSTNLIVSYLGGLAPATLNTHIRVSAAGGNATGTLTGLRCGQPTKGLDVRVVTSAVQPTVEVASATLSVLGVPVTVAVGMTVNPTPGSGSTFSFLWPSEFRPSAEFKHLGGTNLGLSSGTLTVSVVGGGSPIPGVNAGVQAAVRTSLTSILSSIDTAILSPLNKELGLDIGSADVVAALTPFDCGARGLV